MLVRRGVALVAVAVVAAWPPILSIASNGDSHWFRRECVHVVPSGLHLTARGVARSMANATDVEGLSRHHQKTADQATISVNGAEPVPQDRIPQVPTTAESSTTERSTTAATNTAISRLLGVVFTVSTAAIFSIL